MVFEYNALLPTAVFCEPVVFACKATVPIAVLYPPVVFANNALVPKAAFSAPVVLAAKALAPKAVLVETAPAPRPTVRPWMLAPLVTVRLVNVVAPVLSRSVPEVSGSVSVRFVFVAGGTIV